MEPGMLLLDPMESGLRFGLETGMLPLGPMEPGLEPRILPLGRPVLVEESTGLPSGRIPGFSPGSIGPSGSIPVSSPNLRPNSIGPSGSIPGSIGASLQLAKDLLGPASLFNRVLQNCPRRSRTVFYLDRELQFHPAARALAADGLHPSFEGVAVMASHLHGMCLSRRGPSATWFSTWPANSASTPSVQPPFEHLKVTAQRPPGLTVTY
ncbi:hypothetical protein HPB48_021535 [Haemaphysalis longicornis]|uniref:Uncharacterized protein n=1 Tax=Haemaphysalis longicornis TaxID=44386 RepID=A0A9J6GA19_HAELO|nr:hypothetical protein HPB48_021535 [Haemaphysalis longicornis]